MLSWALKLDSGEWLVLPESCLLRDAEKVQHSCTEPSTIHRVILTVSRPAKRRSPQRKANAHSAGESRG
jgi:hypothetical protein